MVPLIYVSPLVPFPARDVVSVAPLFAGAPSSAFGFISAPGVALALCSAVFLSADSLASIRSDSRVWVADFDLLQPIAVSRFSGISALFEPHGFPVSWLFPGVSFRDLARAGALWLQFCQAVFGRSGVSVSVLCPSGLDSRLSDLSPAAAADFQFVWSAFGGSSASFGSFVVLRDLLSALSVSAAVRPVFLGSTVI